MAQFATPSPVQILRHLWSLRREAAGAAVYWSGAGRVFDLLARPSGAIILMYHSIAAREIAPFVDPPNRLSPGMFARQMEFLSRHRKVASLSQVVDQIASGTSPAAGTVCLTFDDGYLDNLTTVAPILEKLRLPATLFLATGYVERAEAQWADSLYWLLTHRTLDRLSLPFIGVEAANLRSRTTRAGVRALLHRRLLEVRHEERALILDEVKRQLVPAGRQPRLTMDWDEARQLQRRYPLVEIGGHTQDHIDLRTHPGATARTQIAGCAEDLQRELGVPPIHFSFPYGRWCADSRAAVVAAGWKSAVGMGERYRIVSTSDRFTMPRVESPRTMTELRFKTSGAYPGMLSTLGLT